MQSTTLTHTSRVKPLTRVKLPYDFDPFPHFFLFLLLGSFSSDFSFIVYHPSTKAMDFSRVP